MCTRRCAPNAKMTSCCHLSGQQEVQGHHVKPSSVLSDLLQRPASTGPSPAHLGNLSTFTCFARFFSHPIPHTSTTSGASTLAWPGEAHWQMKHVQVLSQTFTPAEEMHIIVELQRWSCCDHLEPAAPFTSSVVSGAGSLTLTPWWRW